MITGFSVRTSESFGYMQGPMKFLDYYPWLENILPSFVKNKWMNVDKAFSNRDIFKIMAEVLYINRYKLIIIKKSYGKFMILLISIPITYIHVGLLITVHQNIIAEHKETLDPDNPRDLVDQYLLKMESEKNNPDSVFKDDGNSEIRPNQ